ncbi:MAG TPA: hypothetical protein VMW56_28815 [Candidatus Margulisiibacteriota bacterium]|nr:hypothetical protein [Candidatus Margulisiibacteriota bacterium]
MRDRSVAIAGTTAVLVHGVIAVLHGAAHTDLGIQMTAAENAFINVVIVAAPVVAAMALWTRFMRAGAILLAVSMAGSLLFGAYHHYAVISPDHVAHLPAGNLQGLFRLTALLLVVSEAAGSGVGLWGMKRAAR